MIIVAFVFLIVGVLILWEAGRILKEISIQNGYLHRILEEIQTTNQLVREAKRSQ